MTSPSHSRVDWVDAAKGLCIVFVVMMHSTLGVGNALGETGYMHWVVSFARPFRMPDFFLISGLFLGLVIDRPWRRYIDRKVVHFVYFYVLWLTIQFAFKAPGMVAEGGVEGAAWAYLHAFVEPFGTLWFIYILPLFFVFTRLVDRLPLWMVFGWAALLEILPIHTGWLIFDEFCGRYVYFFAGYAFATRIFGLAEWLRASPARCLALLALWAPVNAALVFTPAPDAFRWLIDPLSHVTGGTGGIAELPVVSLLLGFAGALAIVAVAALVARLAAFRWLGWLGAHSIVVYLAFFLPMAVTRAVLIKLGLLDAGTISLLVTAAGVVGPVLLYHAVQWTGWGRFLFERPAWASIDGRKKAERGLQPAE